MEYFAKAGPVMDRLLALPLEQAAIQRQTIEAAWEIASEFRVAEAALAGIAVPEPLAELHIAIFQFIASLRDGIPGPDPADPLRDIAILEVRHRNIEIAGARMEQIALALPSALEKINLPPGPQSRTGRGFFAALFGIPVAHAWWPVADWLNRPAHLVNLAITVWQRIQKILRWIRLLALQFMKDYLIKKLVYQTIRWIQGGGKPQFVTDWKGFLLGAANQAVGNKLYALEPKLCQSFGPLIKIAVLPVDSYGRNAAVQCTLTQVISNVEDFAENFSKGGWVAYGAALKPSNNLFGSIVQVNDILANEAAAAKKAAKSDAKTAKGYKSTKVCVREEEKPDGTKICLDEENVTPGAVLSKAVNQALGAPVHRIVNANDITALISALVNAALTKIVQLGASTLNKGLRGVEPYVPPEPPPPPGYVQDPVPVPPDLGPPQQECELTNSC
jgi:hypothetical protein